MSFIENGYVFQGPYLSPSELPTYSGVYLVTYKIGSQDIVLDIGQAENIRERIETHDRKACWNNIRKGPLYYYATNVQSDLLRGMLEHSLRQKYNPLCGEK